LLTSFVNGAAAARLEPSWYVDETYVKVKGRWRYLYRAIDRNGTLVDVMLSERRDLAAAKAFFRFARAVTGTVPDRVTSDGHDACRQAIRTALGKTVTHRTNAYLNNRLEQDHREIKGRIRCMRGFGASCLPVDSVAAMMSLATSSVLSAASMSPPTVAVSVSFAEPPLCLRFLRPLERFLPPCRAYADRRAMPDTTPHASAIS
jgi:transposase-like protein